MKTGNIVVVNTLTFQKHLPELSPAVTMGKTVHSLTSNNSIVGSKVTLYLILNN